MQKKKGIALVLSFALVICLGVAGVLAWLTSTAGPVTNTFSVGKVAITLDEADVNEYGKLLNSEGKEAKEGDTLAARVTENLYKLMPGHTYVKDPMVHVSDDSEDSWLFVKVVNQVTAIEKADTIKAQMEENGWILVSGDEKNGVWAYSNVAVSAGDNVPVFGTLNIADKADVAAYADNTIVVNACAVQKDGLTQEQAQVEALAKFNA